jgi:hypothetical protein
VNAGVGMGMEGGILRHGWLSRGTLNLRASSHRVARGERKTSKRRA